MCKWTSRQSLLLRRHLNHTQYNDPRACKFWQYFLTFMQSFFVFFQVYSWSNFFNISNFLRPVFFDTSNAFYQEVELGVFAKRFSYMHVSDNNVDLLLTFSATDISEDVINCVAFPKTCKNLVIYFNFTENNFIFFQVYAKVFVYLLLFHI